MLYENFLVMKQKQRLQQTGMGEIVYMDYNAGKTCLIPDSIAEAIQKARTVESLDILLTY